jgi:hypothetical protein
VIVDWNDPSIEMFPTDRTSIIDTIRRLSERLPEDVPDLDIVPPSPVIGPNGQLLEGRSPAPSPAVAAHQISPSLDSITEENDELQETLVSMSNDVPNVEETSSEFQLRNISKAEKTPAKKTEGSPSAEVPQGSGEPELTSREQREEETTATEEISSQVKEVGPESPPPAPVEPTLNAIPRVPSRITPLVVGDGQLGHDEEDVQEIITGSEQPNITVQPATPAALKTAFIPQPLDEAKSTAIAEENGRQVKSRKKPRSQSPERPITPSSMRSATRDTKSKNLLQAFWHVVFVGWIGGFIRALCGGRGGYT